MSKPAIDWTDGRIKLRHLECFAAIARLGSLKAAAHSLNVTQPALSRSLRDIEIALGARLMTRNRGGIALTPEGAVFLDHARQSLAALRRGVEGVAALRSGDAGALSVGALPSVAGGLLPQAVRAFRRLSPGTRLVLQDGPHAALVGALRAGRLDIVVGRMGAPATMQGLSFTQLYLETVLCVARPGHPALARPDIARLPDWPVLFPPEDAAIRPLVDRWCAANGVTGFGDRIETASGALGRALVRDSDALWFISRGVVAQDLSDGRLAALPLDLGLTAGPVGLMTVPGSPAPAALAPFVEALHEAVDHMPTS